MSTPGQPEGAAAARGGRRGGGGARRRRRRWLVAGDGAARRPARPGTDRGPRGARRLGQHAGQGEPPTAFQDESSWKLVATDRETFGGF